jgi:hypothetical protein
MATATEISNCRLIIGDTWSTEILTDANISYFVDIESNFMMACSRAAGSLAAYFARQVTQSVGDLSQNYSDQFKNYMELAQKLKNDSVTLGIYAATPYCGGLSISDKNSTLQNSDRVQPRFHRGQFNYNSSYKSESQVVVFWTEINA